MNPFQYLSAINDTKQDIMVDDISEKQYNAFMVNRGLSYFYDTVLLANEMNQRAHLDNRLQFDFFINTIRKKKRFSKRKKSFLSFMLHKRRAIRKKEFVGGQPTTVQAC